MAGYVYLIWMEDSNHYKIGMAKDPAKRLKALQTGHSRKLHLIASMKCNDPHRKESYLHQKYRQYRIEGEWFSIPPLVLQAIFDEFRFHVPQTPDEPIYYWVSQAKAWQKTAEIGREQVDKVGNAVVDHLAFAREVDAISHEFTQSLIPFVSPEHLGPLAEKHRTEMLELQLLARQIGIIEEL